MITEEAVREIIAQYNRFGWKLERIILKPEVRSELSSSAPGLFDKNIVSESDLNAAWFSRLNANGRMAWELRALGPTPFALVDSAEPSATESDLNELFQRVENEMRQRVIRPQEN